MVPRHAPSTAPARAVDESMTLLNELQQRPLDPGYAEAAARQASRTEPVRAGVSWVLVVVLAATLGVGVASAALALRHPSADDREARQLLESQLTDRKNTVEQLTASNAQLAAQVRSMQQGALSLQNPSLLATTRLWSIAAGVAPVTGPGLRIVLSDAQAAADDPENLDLRVQDVDLQVLVNGLWAAGAEAIAVNGQRVTGTTAIRSAGSAVLVDLVPLVGPYTVDAIGSAPDLQTKLARSSAGQHIATLKATYGIGVGISSQSALQMPGSGSTSLSSATVPNGALVAAGLADATPTPSVSESAPDTKKEVP
jgi:uncharacterized protein YlxW (UPF0749 family)